VTTSPGKDVRSLVMMARQGRVAVVILALALVAAGCAERAAGPGATSAPGTPGGATTTAGPTPAPPAASARSIAALKLLVLDAVGGRLSYCDPDEYPVGRGEPIEAARERLPAIQADREAYAAILEHEAIDPGAPLTDDQLVAVNEDYKQMQAIDLQPSGAGYAFLLIVPAEHSPIGNESVGGSVDPAGKVTIEERRPVGGVECPICLGVGTSIDTPTGPVPIQALRTGMGVWTTDLQGRRVVGRVLATARTLAPPGHRMVHLTLGDGRTLLVSPGHPAADGRMVGRLRTGDVLDGTTVASAPLLTYAGGYTFDILVSGPTGTYLAGGVPLRSTLTPA
jgi:hypothetical protein